MPSTLTTILALLALFYILGKSADLAIHNLRVIAERLGIGVFFLGLMMGIFTSFPELAIGINALVTNVPNIALGNLFGGIVVLFGLILGVNVFLQRKIKSEQNALAFGLALLFLLLPMLLGINGTLSALEGLIIIAGYFLVLLVMYYRQPKTAEAPRRLRGAGLAKNFWLFLLGLVLVLLVANLTINLTAGLLSQLPLSRFVIGVVIFAIGTNFPEIIIALRAWQNSLNALSLSTLLGSGLANMLLVGIFAVMREFQLTIDHSYYLLVAGTAIVLALLFVFYRTGRALKRAEGVVLVLAYLLFITLQIIW
ncbi:MAG: hypothetical protein Q8Q23_03250 [bacterium]|nr:hypothetical protein [bacterium]